MTSKVEHELFFNPTYRNTQEVVLLEVCPGSFNLPRGSVLELKKFQGRSWHLPFRVSD